MKNAKQSFIALGSNLENPIQQIIQAFVELANFPQTSLITKSSLYQSKALTLPKQNPNSFPDYVNAVACLQTHLSPQQLLQQCQTLESAHGRKRLKQWEPRTLDLDILLYDNLVLHSTNLIIPHPEMHKRNFVLYPLAEIAPGLILPSGKKLETVLKHISNNGLLKIIS